MSTDDRDVQIQTIETHLLRTRPHREADLPPRRSAANDKAPGCELTLVVVDNSLRSERGRHA